MNDTTRNILVPVDFNTPSLIALKQAYLFARILDAEIRLVYVHEEPGFVASLFSSFESDKILQKIQAELHALANRASVESGLTIIPVIRKGRVHTHIVDLANSFNSTLIIMGTCGDDERTRNLLGANTSRVIRSAECPVISVNQDQARTMIRNILLPLDLTKETRQKVNWGVAMAKGLGAGIKAVSALWSVNDPDIRMQLKNQLAQVKAFIESEGIHCTAEIIEKPGDSRTMVPVIMNYAQQQDDIDLIIIMTQQEIEMVEFFIGSTAHEIIRKSHVPVMSIVPKEMGFTSILS